MESFDLRDYLQIILKRWWMVVGITSLCTLASAFISFNVLTPIYEAETQLLIYTNEETEEFDGKIPGEETTGTIPLNTTIDAHLKLTQTYKEIILSPSTLKDVYKEISDSITLKTNQGNIDPITNLKGLLRAEFQDKSQIISIYAEHSDPKQAILIADTVAQLSEEKISSLMGVDNIQVLSPAYVNPTPIKPYPYLYISFSFLIGLMISIIVVSLLGKPTRKYNQEQHLK